MAATTWNDLAAQFDRWSDIPGTYPSWLSVVGGETFPRVWTDVAFDSRPGDATQTWTDVSSFVSEAKTSLKRQYELDRMEAGTATCVFENYDRRFEPGYTGSPYYPNVKRKRRLRMRATYHGQTHDIYSGFVDAWPPFWEGPDIATTSVPCIDSFERMALRKIPQQFPQQTTGERINLVLDAIGHPQSARDIDTGQTTVQALDEDATPNLITNGEFETDVAGWTAIGTNTIARSTAVARYGTASAKLTKLDAGNLCLGYTTVTYVALPTLTLSALVWVYVPSAFTGTSVFIIAGGGTPPADGEASAEADLELRDRWQLLSVRFTPKTYLTHSLSVWSTGGTTGADQFVYIDGVRWGEAGSDAPALQHVLDMAQAEIGLFFINGQDVATFHDRHRRMLGEYLVSQVTLGDGADELPYEAIMPQYGSGRLFNRWEVAVTDGPMLIAADADSIAEYGPRDGPKQIVPLADPNLAADYGNYLLLTHADPAMRFEQVELDPVAITNCGIDPWPHILGRKIGDRVTVKKRPPGGGGPVAFECHIEGIEHDIGPGKRWRTRWNLTPTPWSLSVWTLGTAGKSELGETTILGF